MKNILESINDVDFKYRNILNFDKKYKFGIEIEFEGASHGYVEEKLFYNKCLKNWDLHNEPTVEEDVDDIVLGGEIVSPILHNNKRTWIKIKEACQMLKRIGAFCDEYCGAHIHIDQSILCDNNKYILNLFKLWTIYEHIIYQFSFGERRKGRMYLCCYAYELSVLLQKFMLNTEGLNDINLYQSLMNFLDEEKKSLKGGLWFSDCKGVYSAVNNTIEIRCPNGTLNEIIWQNNINFYINLLETCASELDEDFINYKFSKYQNIYNYNSNQYIDDALELADIIFTDDIDKIYFLKQYVKKYNNNHILN